MERDLQFVPQDKTAAEEESTTQAGLILNLSRLSGYLRKFKLPIATQIQTLNDGLKSGSLNRQEATDSWQEIRTAILSS